MTRLSRAVLAVGPASVLVLAGCAAETPPPGAGEEPLRFRVQPLFMDAERGIGRRRRGPGRAGGRDRGSQLVRGPRLHARPLRLIEDWDGYVQSNGDHVYDVNGDGYPDVVSGGFMLEEVHWYENPGAEGLELGHLWKQHVLIQTDTSENEGQWLADLDGDGVPEWLVSSWIKDRPLVAWKVENLGSVETEAIARRIVIGESRNGHGLGLGDLSGDGRADLLFEDGWYERPAEAAFEQPWTLHEDWSIHASIPMLVVDVDGDGRNDVIVGESHDYGLYWLRQLEAGDGPRFERHVIDDTFSQVHALHLADLDGDGDEELIAGKRVLAHNGNDPGGHEPPCLYYYQWDPGSGQLRALHHRRGPGRRRSPDPHRGPGRKRPNRHRGGRQERHLPALQRVATSAPDGWAGPTGLTDPPPVTTPGETSTASGVMMSEESAAPRTFGRTLFAVLFTNRTTIAAISVVLLVAISALPNLGVIAGWVFILVALLACVRQGGFGEIGFRRPGSWPRTILLAIAFGVAIQLVFSIVVDPLLARWTGTPVDVSSLDGMRGNLVNYLIMLAVGWVHRRLPGGDALPGLPAEENPTGARRQRRPRRSSRSCCRPWPSACAHSYQDTAGMISTGLIGAILGALFVWYRGNLWLPIMVHGFSNVVGITLIYTSGDRVLNALLFG